MGMHAVWVKNPNRGTPGEPAMLQHWVDTSDLEEILVADAR